MDGVPLHANFDLPMIKFEKNHVEYEITDIRPLNKDAVNVIERIFTLMYVDPSLDEFSFEISDDMSDQEVELIIDIIMSLTYKINKRGKNGFSFDGALLPCGTYRTERNGEKILTLVLYDGSIKQAVAACMREGPSVSWLDLPIALCEIKRGVYKS